MNTPWAGWLRPPLAVSALVMIAGCGLLDPKVVPQPAFYILAPESNRTGRATLMRRSESLNAPTLVIHQPQAETGFDSSHIVYFRDPLKLEYFAHSDWIDTPARMLAPLLVAAFDNDIVFNAVLTSPSSSPGDLSLDVVIVRLQQNFEFRPSHVRLTLRATVTDTVTGRPLAWREFDEQITAASDDPYGGIVAANTAVEALLPKLVLFCDEAASLRKP